MMCRYLWMMSFLLIVGFGCAGGDSLDPGPGPVRTDGNSASKPSSGLENNQDDNNSTPETPDEETDDPCTPQSCDDVGATCGEIADGCGATIECGECSTGEACVANACEPCEAETEAEICDAAGAMCGDLSVVDSCGVERIAQCGSCLDGEACVEGQCACQPVTCDEIGTTRSLVADGCGGTILCGGDGSQALALGGHHSCVIDASRGAQCWGKNKDGQLGTDSRVDAQLPADVVGLSDVYALTAGEKHSCAATSSGVYCWGDNDDQQMAGSSNDDALVPVQIPGLTNVSSIASGGFHTCAVIESTGGAKCWGYNGWAQLGNGTFSNPSTPVDVVFDNPAPQVRRVEAGPLFTCFVTVTGELYCLGENTFGQVGTQMNYDDPVTPQHVTGLDTPLVDVATGGWFGGGSGVGPSITGFTCVVESSGGVKCFGANIHGQLGAGMTSGFASHSLVPVQVSGLTSNVVQVVAGGEHACALRETGEVSCWGFNTHGELGDGTTVQSDAPVDVSLPERAVQLFAGGFHTCAALESGAVECWGKNSKGQIGDGTTNHAMSPVSLYP